MEYGIKFGFCKISFFIYVLESSMRIEWALFVTKLHPLQGWGKITSETEDAIDAVLSELQPIRIEELNKTFKGKATE